MQDIDLIWNIICRLDISNYETEELIVRLFGKYKEEQDWGYGLDKEINLKISKFIEKLNRD